MRSQRCLFTAKAALLVLTLFGSSAHAQNSICPDVAAGDSSNRCANTRFVLNQILSSGLIIGSTVINGGTNPDILYDNNGVLGNLPVTGTAGNVVLSNGPSISSAILTTPSLGVASGTSLALGGATIGTDTLAITGTSSFSSHIVTGGNITLGTANTFLFSGRSRIQSPADGDLRFSNSTGTDFTSLKLGGSTASFPEIKRNATAINFRLADDSADAPITASTGAFSGPVTHGTNGGSAGQIIANGSTSGAATITAQAAAGSAALLWPTGNGTLASSGTSPISLDATTGAISCATCTTSAASLTANQLVIGSSSQGMQSLGSLGTTTTLLHGNAGGAPTFGAVGIGDVSGSTGTVNFVFSASPTLTGTPVLAAPSATTLIIGSSTTLPSPAVLVITNNASTLPNPVNNTALQIGGADGMGLIMDYDTFGGSATQIFRRANGTVASKTALAIDNNIVNFGGLGYGATGYSASNRIRFAGSAAEAWTDTAQGTYISFFTTPLTTIATAEAVRIQGSGGVSIGTTTDLGIGTLLANSTIKTLSTTAATSSTTGSGIFGGGLGVAGAIWAGTYLDIAPTVVNSLPSCVAGIDGARSFVTNNATAVSFGGAVTTGGATHSPVYCDGAATAWKQG